ncbi:MAG: hypothetical protein M0P19_10700 [Nevskia sp.]|jgi:hypothetical protein|nr:hypothetical protein [Nevskia sp.]MCK9383897.1 hypothetical protein [Nevskia sp.]
MQVSEFEYAVWAVEGIRITVRAPSNMAIGTYNYQNAANEGWRITQLLENRILPNVNGHEVVVLQGDGEEPHGRVILRTLRASYA